MTRFEVFAQDEAGEIERGIHNHALVEHRRLRDGAERRRRQGKVESGELRVQARNPNSRLSNCFTVSRGPLSLSGGAQ
jgi:hypothetical protein